MNKSHFLGGGGLFQMTNLEKIENPPQNQGGAVPVEFYGIPYFLVKYCFLLTIYDTIFRTIASYCIASIGIKFPSYLLKKLFTNDLIKRTTGNIVYW